MDINDLTLGQINELKAMFGSGCKTGTSGKHVLVRTFSAGVHVGYLTSKEGTNVVLSRARRIWRWGGAFTCSEIAMNGLNPSKSRMAIEVPSIELTQATEIVETTQTARMSFDKTTEV